MTIPDPYEIQSPVSAVAGPANIKTLPTLLSVLMVVFNFGQCLAVRQANARTKRHKAALKRVVILVY